MMHVILSEGDGRVITVLSLSNFSERILMVKINPEYCLLSCEILHSGFTCLKHSMYLLHISLFLLVKLLLLLVQQKKG